MAAKKKGGILDGLADLIRDIYKDLKEEVLPRVKMLVKTKVTRELLLAGKMIVNQKVAVIGPPA